jgi:hypothetical protein
MAHRLHRWLQAVAALVLVGVAATYLARALSMASVGSGGVLDALGRTAAVGAGLVVAVMAVVAGVAHGALTSWLVDPGRGAAHVLRRHLAVAAILGVAGVLAWAIPQLVPG